MLYIVSGTQSAMVKKRVSKIVQERLPEQDEMNFARFDMRNSLIQDVIQECNMMPLGYDHKLIVAEDAEFLRKTTKKARGEDKNDLSAFAKYIKNDNEDCDLILTLIGDDIDEKAEVYKLIKDKGMTIKLQDLDKRDWDGYIFRYFNESLQTKIDRDAISELAIRVKGDLNVFVNEAEKLALFNDHVTYEDVCNLVNRPLEENAFELFNLLMANKNGQALKLFNDLKVDGVEPVRLISMLANQFRLLWQIAYLSKTGLDNASIANELKIKEIRVKILKRYMFSLTSKDLLKVLDDLYDLDYKIKSGQVDRFYNFELFLINFNVA